jgi:hypothetical protein
MSAKLEDTATGVFSWLRTEYWRARVYRGLLVEKQTKDVASFLAKSFMLCLFVVSLFLPRELSFSFWWVWAVFVMLSLAEIDLRVERTKLARQMHNVYVDKTADKLEENVTLKEAVLECGLVVHVFLWVALYVIGVASRYPV